MVYALDGDVAVTTTIDDKPDNGPLVLPADEVKVGDSCFSRPADTTVDVALLIFVDDNDRVSAIPTARPEIVEFGLLADSIDEEWSASRRAAFLESVSGTAAEKLTYKEISEGFSCLAESLEDEELDLDEALVVTIIVMPK
jgi:hypothetical protein